MPEGPGSRRPEIRSRRTFCRRPKTPRRRARGLPVPRGWGPDGECRRTRRGAAAPGMPTRWAFPVPGSREDSDSNAGGLTSAGGGDARPRGDPLGPKVGSTPEARAGSFPEGRGKADARKFGSGNGLRRSAFGMRLLKTPQPPARKPSGEKFRPAPSPGPADRGKQREPPAFRAARGRPGQCFKAPTSGSLPLPRGWGPRMALPQDSATGAAAPGMPTRWACPVPGNRKDSPDGSGARPGGTRNAYPRGSKRRGQVSSSGEPQPEGGPEEVQTATKNAGAVFPAPGLSESATLCPESAAASSRQRPQEARREKKRTKQSCSVRLPDCYSAAFCAASARASASLARASASFRFAAASFSFASAS